MVISSLLKSLKNIYENSTFYKEAQIISFIDKLLQCIMSKIKAKVNVNACMREGQRYGDSYAEFQKKQIEEAKAIVSKF